MRISLPSLQKSYRYYESFGRLLYGKRPLSQTQYYQTTRNYNYEAIKPEEALQCGTVVSCLKDYINAIAEVPFIAPEDPYVNALLKQPNSYQIQRDFMGSCIFTLILWGEVLIQLGYGTDGKISSMAALDPDQVIINIDENTRRPYYTSTRDERRIPAKDVIHMRYIPTNTLANVNILSAYALQIRALIACDKLINKTYNNGIHVGYTINTTENLTTEEFDALKEQIEKYKPMLDNGIDYDRKSSDAGSAIVLDNGLEIKQIAGMKLADIDLREVKDQLKAEITAGIFGRPPYSTGAKGDQKYNNVSARDSITHREAYSPIIRNFVSHFEAKFNTKIVAHDEFLARGSFAECVKSGDILVKGQWSQNEVRERLYDMEPKEGGDKLPPIQMTSNQPQQFPTDNGTGSPDLTAQGQDL